MCQHEILVLLVQAQDALCRTEEEVTPLAFA